ncbi:MAG: DoxX family protein [Muribaculaceae bacterium]|nr:DoxX family protein [Muribaculaceae bacterium]
MNILYRFLFPEKPKSRYFSIFLLALRILFGILLLSHGIQKWAHFESLSTTFPDPLGIGSVFSLSLAIFAELFCSIFFIAGFLYRLVLLPMIATMAIAFIFVHSGSVANGGELAFIYLAMFVLLYIAGPGRYSFDRVISYGLMISQKQTI